MPNDKRAQYQQLLEASSLGLMFPLAIGIGFGMGYGLDRLFHTKPWCTVIFTVFGVIAAFINLFRTGMGSDGGKPPASGT
jgi:F0F1-type ATP synthase assembly protein I